MVKKKNENNEVQKDEPARNASASVADGSKQQIEDLENQLKRTLADYQNLEKRVAEEKSSWIRMANKQLLQRILPVLDTLMLAQKHLQDEGLNLSVQQFLDALEAEGVERVKTEGQPFDPNIMEAVEKVEGIEGKVIEETRPGFTLQGQVLRPAQVKVGGQI